MRYEKGLTQLQMASILGTDRGTLIDWELDKTIPAIDFFPKIIEQMGYFPISINVSTISGKVKKYRYCNGLSQEKLARQLGIGSTSVYRIESNQPTISKKMVALFEKLPLE